LIFHHFCITLHVNIEQVFVEETSVWARCKGYLLSKIEKIKKHNNKFFFRFWGWDLLMGVLPPLQENKKKVSNYKTHKCDFNTQHKSDFYTQSAISTRRV
jgi:hypothetical protein